MELTAEDGTTLAVTCCGPEQGVPIVFVNGSFAGLDSWDPVLDKLHHTYPARVYSRRGYPPSGGPAPGHTFATDVADLALVVAAAGGRAHLVGGSYGATVGLHAVRAAAVDAVSLTLFEPPLYAAGPTLDTVLERVRAHVAAHRYASASRTMLAGAARVPDELLGLPGREDDPKLRAMAAGFVADLEAMTADSSDVERWRDVAVPVQVLRGELTWSPMPETMAALLSALPDGAREVVFAGQSHFAPHTAAADFAAAIADFADSADSADSAQRRAAPSD